jgi:hypothetical protein
VTALDELRLLQRDHETYPSDHAATAYFTSVDPNVARLDLTPVTAIERRMLASHRRTA